MCYAHPSDDTESTPVSSIVVIPTYNERDNLTALTERLLALNLPLDILFIDDNSPDGTGKLADDLADSIPPGVSAPSRAQTRLWNRGDRRLSTACAHDRQD